MQSLGVFRIFSVFSVLTLVSLVCVYVCQICNYGLKPQPAPMSPHWNPNMWRQDPLKVFLGNLHRDIIKPTLQKLCSFHDLEPVQIDVPTPKANQAAIAFLVFSSPEQAAGAVTCLHGAPDGPCSPGLIQAFRVANMGAFNISVFRESLGLYVFRDLGI